MIRLMSQGARNELLSYEATTTGRRVGAGRSRRAGAECGLDEPAGAGARGLRDSGRTVRWGWGGGTGRGGGVTCSTATAVPQSQQSTRARYARIASGAPQLGHEQPQVSPSRTGRRGGGGSASPSSRASSCAGNGSVLSSDQTGRGSGGIAGWLFPANWMRKDDEDGFPRPMTDHLQRRAVPPALELLSATIPQFHST